MGEEKTNLNCCWFSQICHNKKEWLKIHLWHPLKPRYIFYILFLFAAIVFAFLMDYFYFSRLSEGESGFAFTFNIASSIIIVIFVFYFTQIEIKRLEYAVALKKLLIEIGENKDKLFEFNQRVDESFDEFEKEKKWKWIPKQNSYTNWASGNNFQYKYFATNAYFNFVNKGHILNTKYLQIPQGQIANIYEIFFDFNIKLQQTENLINNFEHNDHSQFKTEKDIQKYLKCEFYNNYINDHINNGFNENYQNVYNQLSQYFNFESRDVREKEIKKI